MDQVDVVLLTKNSAHILSKCLASIYENVPLKNLIVIDGFSTDGTLQILEDFNKAHRNIALFQVDGSRAKARTTGIRHVSTELFLFVDSDVVLCKDWYKKAEADLKSARQNCRFLVSTGCWSKSSWPRHCSPRRRR